MSDGSGGAQSSIQAAYERLPEIQLKRTRARIIKLMVPLAVLFLLLGGIWQLYEIARSNTVERADEFKSHFSMRMNQILPRIESQSRASVDRVLPRLQKELSAAQAKAAKALPEELETHTKGMGEKLEKMMNERVAAAIDRVGKQQREKLANTFPEQLKCTSEDTPQQCEKKEGDLDVLMDEIQRGYQDWAIAEMRTTFDGHLKAMDDIRITMAKFSKPGKSGEKTGTAMGNPDAPADMLMLFLEIAAETMGGSDDYFETEGR